MIAILTVFCLIAFAGGGKGRNSSGGEDSNLPNCEDIYTGTMNLGLTKVNLSYDLSDYADIPFDIQELQQAHWEMQMMSGYKGSITQLTTILVNANQYPEERKPVCEASFGGADCKGMIPHTFSLDEVEGNIIKNIPNFGVNLKNSTLNIKTIKSSVWDLQIIWNETINFQSIANVIWDDDAELNCNWIGIVKSTPISKGGAGRDKYLARAIDSETYEFIPNYAPFDIEDELHISKSNVKIIYDSLRFSPSLLKPVYSGGEYCTDKVWLQPIALEIVE